MKYLKTGLGLGHSDPLGGCSVGGGCREVLTHQVVVQGITVKSRLGGIFF